MKRVLIAVLITSFLTTNGFAQSKTAKPVVNTPDQFRGVPTTASLNQTSIGDLKWFEVFNDVQLQKLIHTALVQNYDLRSAIARVDAERANLGLARSNQFPQFEVGTDLTTSRTSRNGPSAAPGQSGKTRSFGSVFLSLLNFELDVWGRVRNQTKAARAQLHASEEDRKAIMTTVVSDVATGYFSLLELDSELEIAKRTLATRENSLQLIRIRQQGGLATELDVRQAEELVYQASQTIPNTEQAIEQTENQINFLLGNNPASIPRGKPLIEQHSLRLFPQVCLPNYSNVVPTFALLKRISKLNRHWCLLQRLRTSRELV